MRLIPLFLLLSSFIHAQNITKINIGYIETFEKSNGDLLLSIHDPLDFNDNGSPTTYVYDFDRNNKDITPCSVAAGSEITMFSDSSYGYRFHIGNYLLTSINCESINFWDNVNRITHKPEFFAEKDSSIYVHFSGQIRKYSIDMMFIDSFSTPNFLAPQFFFFKNDSIIEIGELNQGKIHNFNIYDQTITSKTFNPILGNAKRVGNEYHAISKVGDDYQFQGVNSDGVLLPNLTLKDTCKRCVYTRPVYAPNQGIYLLGKVAQFETTFTANNEPSVADHDLVVSKFDFNGNLVFTKMIDDRTVSEAVEGFIYNNEFILFGEIEFPDYAPLRKSPISALILTDTDFSDFIDIEYQQPPPPIQIDTIPPDTVVIDTIEINDEVEITIGPNPTSDIITFKTNHRDKNFQLKVFDWTSNLMIREEEFILSFEFSVADLNNGYYIYLLTCKETGDQVRGKFLVYK